MFKVAVDDVGDGFSFAAFGEPPQALSAAMPARLAVKRNALHGSNSTDALFRRVLPGKKKHVQPLNELLRGLRSGRVLVGHLARENPVDGHGPEEVFRTYGTSMLLTFSVALACS